MVAPNLCDQCKSHIASVRSSPCGSSKSTPRSCSNDNKPKDKPIYVKAETVENPCIVLDNGGGKCGGNISLQLPSPSSKLKFTCGGKSSSSSCIKIMGNSVIKTSNGGLQIIPCKGGGGNMQISMAGGRPVLQLGGGGGSSRQCGSSGGSGGGCPSGQLQLNFGKGGSPSITCGPSGSSLQIIYG
ncbi:hypothetical protein M758_1G196000 [Ceratodon purpureus]|nr:hypothetical protein M758_1G196000 [Ceratodon purpureus]